MGKSFLLREASRRVKWIIKRLFQNQSVIIRESLFQAFHFKFKKDANGLVPTVVQDYKTGEVLMLAYMSEESYNRTLELGRMTYWSRSRQELWTKGDTSGHYQFVKSLTIDCDKDTILAKVSQLVRLVIQVIQPVSLHHW